MFGLSNDGLAFDPASRINSNLWCKGNYSHTCDPALDDLIAKVGTTIDPDQRVQAYKDVFKYNSDKTYVIYAYQADGAYGMKKAVDWTPWKGIPYTKMGNAQPA
jgi:ABC-type transport system substrate-binding protein